MSRFEKILTLVRENPGLLTRWRGVGLRVAMVLFCSWIVASTGTSALIPVLGDAAMGGRPARGSLAGKNPRVDNRMNYRDLRKDVLKRNIFNSKGEVPDESTPEVDTGAKPGDFNASAPCQKSGLNLELLGTIILGAGGGSLATVREKGYNIADIYRAGDVVHGNSQATVFAVEKNRVVINNNGVKECLEKKKPRRGFASSSPSPPSRPPPADDGMEEEGGSASHFVLEQAYVEEALGPGFSKILESGRLVPHNREGKMRGFKLIGVKPDSLFRKVGLGSGDVITGVNNTSMTQADQGFTIYQALQDEREIRVDYLQKGKTPSTLTIEIK